MMELRQLRYLEAVLELGTFAAAGEHEHVSQPALWQQVRSLEREWGVRLFERSGRRVRPTPAALSIVPQIHSILDAAGQLEADVGSIRTGRAVAARYAAPRYARSAAFIFEVIARYREHHPEAPSPIAVSVGTAEAIEALASGRIDLAGAVPPPEWPYRAEPVYEVWLAVVDGNGPSVLDVADLAGRPLALLTTAFQSRLVVEDAFRRRGIEPMIAIEHDSPDVLVAAATSGLATAVLVSDALPLGYRGPVSELRDHGRSMGGMLSLVWRSDETLSTAARHLKDEALAAAKDISSGFGPAAVARPVPRDALKRCRTAGRGRCTHARSAARPAS